MGKSGGAVLGFAGRGGEETRVYIHRVFEITCSVQWALDAGLLIQLKTLQITGLGPFYKGQIRIPGHLIILFKKNESYFEVLIIKNK